MKRSYAPRCHDCGLEIPTNLEAGVTIEAPCIRGRRHVFTAVNESVGDYRIVLEEVMTIPIRYVCPDCGWEFETETVEGGKMVVCGEGHRHQIRVTRYEPPGWRFGPIIESRSR